MQPHLYADFQNVDPEGRIRLNTAGTSEDLARQKRIFSGQQAQLYTDDGDSEGGLTIPGTQEVSEAEGIWIAVVDWSLLHRNQAVAEMPRPAALSGPSLDRLAPSHL